MRRYFALLPILLFAAVLPAQDMDNARMDSILHAVTDSITGEPGRWEFHLGGVVMLGLTDETHNRMRIISPVRHIDESSPEEIFSCMEANFHSALDVKYALADDIMWVVYIHPLAALREEQLIDALAQVRSAALTYGTTYTSTDLVFPGSKAEAKRKRDDAAKKKGSKL